MGSGAAAAQEDEDDEEEVDDAPIFTPELARLSRGLRGRSGPAGCL